MERPKVLWFDMTLTTRHAEADTRLSEYFDIHDGSVRPNLEVHPEPAADEAIAFEFDYPDRPGLSALRNTKETYPSTPILMLTTQHSERLAVWAFRNRVMDYLVTPVTRRDLARCCRLLRAVQSAEAPRRKRQVFDYRSRIPVEIPGGQRVREVRLTAALHYVQRRFRHKLRIAEVADYCGMSQFHFSHEFTETFSLTFQEYVLRYRVFRACKELCHPNVPVANVAYSVGFNDPSYFARMFRRYIGVSPSEYCAAMSDADQEDRVEQVLLRLELPLPDPAGGPLVAPLDAPAADCCDKVAGLQE